MNEIFVTKIRDGVIVDFVETEILDVVKSRSIGLQLRELVAQGNVSNLLIDFRHVKLITSSMIGELLQLRQKCDEAKVNLKFCSLSSDLTKLLKITKLDKSFDIYSDREQAVKAFQAKK